MVRLAKATNPFELSIRISRSLEKTHFKPKASGGSHLWAVLCLELLYVLGMFHRAVKECEPELIKIAIEEKVFILPVIYSHFKMDNLSLWWREKWLIDLCILLLHFCRLYLA